MKSKCFIGNSYWRGQRYDKMIFLFNLDTAEAKRLNRSLEKTGLDKTLLMII